MEQRTGLQTHSAREIIPDIAIYVVALRGAAMGDYPTSKGRGKKPPPFIKLTHNVYEHPNYLKLSATSKVLIQDLTYKYRGSNNGDLCAAFSVMKNVGWRSPGTLQRSINELLYFSFIMLTRRGGRNKPHLYALTWLPIDDCGGKLDISPTRTPGHEWKQERPRFDPKLEKQKIGFCTPNTYLPAPNTYLLKVVGE